jgi:hypothetical protein
MTAAADRDDDRPCRDSTAYLMDGPGLLGGWSGITIVASSPRERGDMRGDR